MPINAGYEYGKAESEFNQAGTVQEKLLALRKMLSVAPKHKGAESLLKQIKEKIAKYKELAEKEKKAKKGSGKTLSIKKEGAATICIIGTVNSGKSTLLKKLTNANVLIAPYPFTTKKPEIGVLDYKGIKLQIVEIPAIAEKFEYSELGPSLLAIIRQSDLLIITFKEKSEVYFKDIPHRWHEYRINLCEFKNVSDWSEMTNLLFTIEEWNVKEKRGVVFIDNVRLLK